MMVVLGRRRNVLGHPDSSDISAISYQNLRNASAMHGDGLLASPWFLSKTPRGIERKARHEEIA